MNTYPARCYMGGKAYAIWIAAEDRWQARFYCHRNRFILEEQAAQFEPD